MTARPSAVSLLPEPPGPPEPHPETARIVAEVAARYGVPVMAGAAVLAVPRGLSGLPPLVMRADGLLVTTRTKAERIAAERREGARIARLLRQPDPAVLARRAQVAGLHATGAHVGAIVLALHLPVHTVQNDLRVQGLTPHPAPPQPRAPKPAPSRPSPGASARDRAAAARVAALRAAIGAGVPRERLAETVGVGDKALGRQAKAAGLALPPPASARLRDRALDLIRNGTPRAAVQAETGLSAYALGAILRHAGVAAAPARPVVPRARAAEVAQRRAVVAEMRAGGATVAQIVARTGAGRSTVTKDVAAMGLPRALVATRARPEPGACGSRGVDWAARRAVVAPLAGAGLSVAEIAARTGLDQRVVRKVWSGDVASDRFAAARAVMAARRARVEPLWRAGVTMAQIAAVEGVSVSLISRDVSALGLAGLHGATSASPAVAARRDRVAALMRDGLTVREIGARLGLPKSTVQRDVATVRGMA